MVASVSFAETQLEKTKKNLSEIQKSTQEEIRIRQSKGEPLPVGYMQKQTAAENVARAQVRAAETALTTARKGRVTEQQIKSYVEDVGTWKTREQAVFTTYRERLKAARLQPELGYAGIAEIERLKREGAPVSEVEKPIKPMDIIPTGDVSELIRTGKITRKEFTPTFEVEEKPKDFYPVSLLRGQSLIREPPPMSIGLPTVLTREQEKEMEYLSAFVAPSGGIPEFVKEGFGRMFGSTFQWLGYGKKPDYQKEAYGLIGEPTAGGTMMFRPPTEEELSPGVGYYKAGISEEIGAGIAFEAGLTRKKEEILTRISPGGITELEAKQANIELTKYYKEQQKISKEEFAVREEARQETYFGITPNIFTGKLPSWDFKPQEFERGFYEKKIPGLSPFDIKVFTAGASFLHGGYEGVRTKPFKTAITLGAFVALPPALKVAGVIGRAAGAGTIAAAYPRTTAFLGKSIKYGLGGAYGASVGLRVAFTPGVYGKAGVLGEIVSTEALPMVGGIKLGAYGVRRYEAATYLKSYVEQLPLIKRVEYESFMAEAKAFEKIQPPVKEISLERLELLGKYPKARQALVEYFGKRRLIVGGSIGQETQLYGVKTKRPGDIDIYIKSILGEERKGFVYTKEVRDILRGYGIKGVKVAKGKVEIGGEKLIEFHPYKTYLRFNIEQVTPFYRPAGFGITRTPSGVRVPKIGIQWQRKIVGGYLEPYMTGKIRIKDLPAARAIRKSILGTAEAQTVGRIKEISYMGKGILRRTFFRRTTPSNIFVLKSLPAKPKAMVKEHELIHAIHPLWSEVRVRNIVGMPDVKAGKIGVGRETKLSIFKKYDLRVLKPKGLKVVETKKLGGGTKGVLDYSYTSYKPTKLSGVPFVSDLLYTPTKPTKTSYIPSPYKPSRPRRISPFIYKPSRPRRISPFIYKPTKPERISPFPYKPGEDDITFVPTFEDPETPITPKKTPPLGLLFPELGLAEKKKGEKISRKFFYQPGLAAIGLKLKATKVPKLVGTGIFTRYDVPSYRIKTKKKKK